MRLTDLSAFTLVHQGTHVSVSRATDMAGRPVIIKALPVVQQTVQTMARMQYPPRARCSYRL